MTYFIRKLVMKINSNCQQFLQYQQTGQSALTLIDNTKKTPNDK
jgi:hypothetical protein